MRRSARFGHWHFRAEAGRVRTDFLPGAEGPRTFATCTAVALGCSQTVVVRRAQPGSAVRAAHQGADHTASPPRPICRACSPAHHACALPPPNCAPSAVVHPLHARKVPALRLRHLLLWSRIAVRALLVPQQFGKK